MQYSTVQWCQYDTVQWCQYQHSAVERCQWLPGHWPVQPHCFREQVTQGGLCHISSHILKDVWEKTENEKKKKIDIQTNCSELVLENETKISQTSLSFTLSHSDPLPGDTMLALPALLALTIVASGQLGEKTLNYK